MGINIIEYRANIGSFYNNLVRIRTKVRKNSPTNWNYNKFDVYSFRIIIYCLLVFVPIVVYSITYLEKADVAVNILEKSDKSYISDIFGKYDNLGDCVLTTFLFKMVTNFENRYLHGNRKLSGIKISHWNKGGSHLGNKILEVKSIISETRPHIFGLSEANLFEDHDRNLVEIQDYDLHLPLTHSNPLLECSRIVTYTHKSLVSKPRNDLMSPRFSSIWLEVGLPRQKKFLVCQVYREWQLLNSDIDNASNSVEHQMLRWLEFLDQWERALGTGLEVHVMGDVNLNHCNWTDSNLSTSNQTSKLRPLIQELFSRIFPEGVCQCVTGPTRFWPNQQPSGLDHFYTNRPEKIVKVETLAKGGSDHLLVLAIRNTRSTISRPSYVRKRIYRKFNPCEFIEAVQQISWLDVYLCNDVDKAVTLMSDKIRFILDTMAPLKTIQVRTNYNPWLSEVTKDMIKQRNILHKRAIDSGDVQDWTDYKLIRNRVVSRQKYEGKTNQSKKLSEIGHNSANLWKNVKNILNWSKESSPGKRFVPTGVPQWSILGQLLYTIFTNEFLKSFMITRIQQVGLHFKFQTFKFRIFKIWIFKF